MFDSSVLLMVKYFLYVVVKEVCILMLFNILHIYSYNGIEFFSSLIICSIVANGFQNINNNKKTNKKKRCFYEGSLYNFVFLGK